MRGASLSATPAAIAAAKDGSADLFIDGSEAMTFYDALETRSADARAASLAECLPALLTHAQGLAGYEHLAQFDLSSIVSADDLLRLPVLRKSELGAAQKRLPPFGGYSGGEFDYAFQSPGPLYEPGRNSHDWWRFARFLHATGFGPGDIVQNCFSYHLTPAGTMFENGARAVGAAVLPAGTGQTELQAQAAHDVGVTAYAGTPDYLKVILEKADEMGLTLGISKAAVGGGALFPSLRHWDLGNVAYESTAMDGLILDEGVVVEIVTPGTGNPVPFGEVGEVLVTTLNPDYPLIRFATGDLSAFMEGSSPCGRSNLRIKGWMGRADQTTKIKGMFIRPEQVAVFVAKHPEVTRARVIASRDGEADAMTVKIEGVAEKAADYAASLAETLKLRGQVEVVATDSLPRDGVVIEDQRSYD
jgi:phenylacetate-CoA ligase